MAPPGERGSGSAPLHIAARQMKLSSAGRRLLLAEKIRMGACAVEQKLTFIKPVDQKPIRLNVTLPIPQIIPA
jgi:hypothetical protein